LRFGYIQEGRVVFRLTAVFHDAKAPVGVAGGTADDLQVLGRADVVGTAATDQDSSRSQHLEGT
jgi:hypothetical protein